MSTQGGAEIRARTFAFACDVARQVLESKRSASYRIFDQLLSSSTSVGANLEEAKAASSRLEFVRMCEISLRESREATYWIRICLELGLMPLEARVLQKEAEEISNILAAIVIEAKRKLKLSAAVAGAGCLAMLPLLARWLSS